jgi:hypothetical protein
MTTTAEPAWTDETLRLLADHRRRTLLDELAELGSPTTVDRLVDTLLESSAYEVDLSQEALSLRLHHVHLPQLEAAEVIEYDHRSGAIRRDRDFEDVVSLLRAIQRHRRKPRSD